MRFKAFAGAAVVVLWVAALSACEAEAPDNARLAMPTAAAVSAPSPTPTVALSTVIPVPTPTPTAAPTPTPTPTTEELAAAHLSEIIPWLENPQAAPFGIAELLVDLWVRDRDLGNAVGRPAPNTELKRPLSLGVVPSARSYRSDDFRSVAPRRVWQRFLASGFPPTRE